MAEPQKNTPNAKNGMRNVQTTHDNWAEKLLQTFFPATGAPKVTDAAKQDRAESGTGK